MVWGSREDATTRRGCARGCRLRCRGPSPFHAEARSSRRGAGAVTRRSPVAGAMKAAIAAGHRLQELRVSACPLLSGPPSCRTCSGIRVSANAHVVAHAAAWPPAFAGPFQNPRRHAGPVPASTVPHTRTRLALRRHTRGANRDLRTSILLPVPSVTPKAGLHVAAKATTCPSGETWMPEQVRYDGGGSHRPRLRRMTALAAPTARPRSSRPAASSRGAGRRRGRRSRRNGLRSGGRPANRRRPDARRSRH